MTGMMIFNLIANQLVLRMVSADEGADRLHAHVRGEKVEARGDELLHLALSPGDCNRLPVKSQTTTNPASASIRLSAPNPINAIELAATPAAMAIAELDEVPGDSALRQAGVLGARASPAHLVRALRVDEMRKFKRLDHA